MAGKKYLVTGVAGFIGSHLAETLLERGEREIRGVDNLSTGKRENMTSFDGRIDFLEGSLTDLEVCRRAVEGVDVVFHQAAVPSVPRSVQEPLASHEANATATMNLLLAARDAGVRRLVYAGSSSAYGHTDVFPEHEDLPVDPRSPYAASKLAGEGYCKAFSNCYDIDCVILRYFNVFGPRQDPLSPYGAVIPKFIYAFRTGQKPIIYGDGTQKRDFTFVRNNTHANLLAAEAEGVSGEVINIAGGQEVSVNEVAEQIAEVLGVPCEVEYAPPRAGDVPRSNGDCSKAQRLLGYETQVDFREGLAQTVEWFRSQE